MRAQPHPFLIRGVGGKGGNQLPSIRVRIKSFPYKRILRGQGAGGRKRLLAIQSSEGGG